MDELSLYVLDICMNSVRAGAKTITILLTEEGEILRFSVEDDGCGMDEETVRKIKDPFFTTRTTRKVGLGIPFLEMLAGQTGGGVTLRSTPEGTGENHGTFIEATFGKDHVDFIPLGDMAATVTTLIQGAPDVRFVFRHKTDGGEVFLDTDEIRAILGDISPAEPEVLSWIGENLREQYRDLL